jgi:hypothetical protein
MVWNPVTRSTWVEAVRPQVTFGGQFTEAEMEVPFVIVTEAVDVRPREKILDLLGWGRASQHLQCGVLDGEGDKEVQFKSPTDPTCYTHGFRISISCCDGAAGWAGADEISGYELWGGEDGDLAGYGVGGGVFAVGACVAASQGAAPKW